MLLWSIVAGSLLSMVQCGSLMEELAAQPNTNIIVDLLNQTGLADKIDNDYLTLFAPTDDAFAALPDDMTKTVLGNNSILMGVLQFHATHGIFRSMDATDNMLIKSLLTGSDIRVNVYNDPLKTLFITLNGAKVVTANLQCTNGYLHVIDRVMFPPLGTFYDLISASDIHKTLKGIIDGLNLQSFVETVTGTLFAPTDAAFESLFTALKDAGMNPEDERARREYLLYHILEDVVYSAGGQPGTYVTRDMGEKLTVSVNNGTVSINQAAVVLGDLAATNGVVHIIDSVLVPPAWVNALIG